MRNLLGTKLSRRVASVFRRRSQSDAAALDWAEHGMEVLEEALNTGDPETLDVAVNWLDMARVALARDHPDRPALLSNLGVALRIRFERTDRAQDLDEAIDLARRAVDSIPEGNLELSGCLYELGAMLYHRFERTDQIDDLNESIALARRAADTTGEGRLLYLSDLGSALCRRFQRSGGVEDLEEAISLARRAADTAPLDHPDRPKLLANLGSVLGTRFEHAGRLEDLEQAITLFRQAADDIPEYHQAKGFCLSNLQTALRIRFERTGRLEDLDEAIALARRAIGVTPAGHRERPRYLDNLGSAVYRRFERIGGIEDLDEAIDLARRAVEASQEDHPQLPRYLSDLATALHDRFRRAGRTEDLDEAITLARRAVDFTPFNHPDQPRRAAKLGDTLQGRYALTGRMEDLDEAIDLGHHMTGSTPIDHPDRPMNLSHLGTALHSRYERTGRMEDLDTVIGIFRQAAASAPEDLPARSLFLTNLGLALRDRFDRTQQVEDLDEAVEVFRLARGVVSAPVHVRVHAAREWGRAAALGENWAQTVAAYGDAVDLAGLVASPELGRADQEHRLGQLSGLGPEAAAACVQAGRPDRAVELFEHGRAVLFSRVLDARSDVTGLRQAHPELAGRFVRWRDALEVPDPGPSGLSLDGEDGGRAGMLRIAAERRREAATGLEQVLAEIRSRPGFERFLLPRPVEELLPAAAEGPVVLLNVASLRSDALILSEGDVEVLPLEEASPEEVGRQLTAFLAALDEGSESALAGVLAWLGERVTGPVLDHLGYTTTPSAGVPWPRVWWCPSGALSLWPLHAAGRHEVSDGPPNAVIDRVISSTVPTVRALLRARQGRPPESEPRMLVVAMPATPGQADLPAVYREADTLRKLYAGRVDVLGLPGTGSADYDHVMAALPGHPLVHFCCHGESDLSDPSSSHLLLADYQTRPLTVLDLTGARLQGAEMAFLSACTTARTGPALPDEPIHLAAACQLAGYRQVIASLWPIGDDDTAALTKDFYTTLTTANAAAALHHATRRLRLIYRDRPSHWAPYTYTGP